MVRPIPTCIPQMQISQIFRVLLFQIKNGYPISSRQINIPIDWEQVLPSYEYLRIDNIERRADESAPHIRTIPPAAAEAFRQAAEKIDDTQVKLKHPTPETEKLRIFRWQFS